MTKRLALALGLRDRVDLAERSIGPLLHDDIDLFLIDGSRTEVARKWAEDQALRHNARLHANVTGGADAWIVYALTTLLNSSDAPYVGICENDVLLHRGWLVPTLACFDRAVSEGLEAGAVSARCYEDRILCQRDGYALCHNLGAGHIILTREAARLALSYARTSWTTENRKTFHQFSGIDIARHWAFRGDQHMVTLDWGVERVLAAHGFASLALTPSEVEMIGQDPPLHEQGLTIVKEPVEWLRNDRAFGLFALRTEFIREGKRRLPDQMFCRPDEQSQIIFPHQIGTLNGYRGQGWRLKWMQGFGPFAFVADQPDQVDVTIAGPCSFFVSGGKEGGKVRIVDIQSGYEMEPDLPPEGDTNQVMQLAVPGNIAYRTVRLTAITPGTTFYGIKVNEPQPIDPTWAFDHSVLPKP